MDSCIVPLRFENLHLVQTTDFFYPLVDDPYIMGRIACANVLSDLYAMGVVNVDNMLMILGISTDLTDEERDIVIPMMLSGFNDCAAEAGTSVQGGQTVKNPWLTIGGVGTSVCPASEYILPTSALPGDVLVLTKPIGTQVAVNAYEWLENPSRWAKIKGVITEEEVKAAYYKAMEQMAKLNRNARLMHKYNAHGATDVTGFGLIGHAQNLAKIQTLEVGFVIHNLPIIGKMVAVSKAAGNMFGLLQGVSAETSGGLLIALPRDQAANFCKELESVEGPHSAWIVGMVEKGPRTARIIDNPKIIEVLDSTAEILQEGDCPKLL